MNGDRQCHSFDRLLSLASRYWPALSQNHIGEWSKYLTTEPCDSDFVFFFCNGFYRNPRFLATIGANFDVTYYIATISHRSLNLMVSHADQISTGLRYINGFEAQSIPQASFFIASSSVTQLRWVSTCRTRILHNLLFLSRLVSHSVEATSARSHPSRFLFGCKSTSLPVCALLHHSSFMFWLWLCF